MKVENFWLSRDKKASHILVENICKTYLTKNSYQEDNRKVFNYKVTWSFKNF